MTFLKKRPEITWSIMHPTKPTLDYMREIINAAENYTVDSFEMCGDAHGSTGNMEGVIRFRDYPVVAKRLDTRAMDEHAALLRNVAQLAHDSGRPLFYWHREVMVPPEVIESVPGLLDEDGEFNLLGDAYRALVVSKIREFFDAVPNMDGIVLTVTESDYSVIHNSCPERYPPATVVKHLSSIFAGELNRLGKRFILRSFGSIAQDYEDILEGARLVGGLYDFEIETKITPYDFSPFLPMNPYLKRTGRFSLSAEYDSIGEFLGAGYLPAADPERMIECVRHATAMQVDRHVIRVDRIGHSTAKSAQAVNLYAFDRAINDPGVTSDAIWQEWSAINWPECGEEMVALMRRGIEMVKRAHFIAGNVIFHAFPIDPAMKWIKACGILSLFKPGFDLSRHTGMWGILAEGKAPSRAEIMREKDEAVRIADECLGSLRTLKSRLPDIEYAAVEKTWLNAMQATRLIRAFCNCVCAYFDDMEAARDQYLALEKAMALAKPVFENVLACALSLEPGAMTTVPSKKSHEYGDNEPLVSSVQAAYAKPLWKIIQSLPAEYRGEFAERAEWRATPGIVDFVVCGGVGDDWRVRRYMHASHAPMRGDRPARIAGNRVFPNGFIECELEVPRSGRFKILVKGEPSESAGFLLALNAGEAGECHYDHNGVFETQALSPHAQAGSPGKVKVRIQKMGRTYPWIYGIASVVAG